MVWIINLKEPGSTYSHSHRLEDTPSIAITSKLTRSIHGVSVWVLGIYPLVRLRASQRVMPWSCRNKKKKRSSGVQQGSKRWFFSWVFQILVEKRGFLDQRYVDVCWTLTSKMVLCCKFAVFGFSDFTVTRHRTSWTTSFQLSNDDLLWSGPGKCNEIMKDLYNLS